LGNDATGLFSPVIRLFDSGLASEAADGMNTTIILGPADTRNIKTNRELCRSQVDCLLSVDAGVVSDLNSAVTINFTLRQGEIPIFQPHGECLHARQQEKKL